MPEDTVHTSRLKTRLAFEVDVNESEMLSLLKEIIDTAKTLQMKANSLLSALEVAENIKAAETRRL